jgi:SAM-dependent methyltransferase
MLKDDLYDYSQFTSERVKEIFTDWDGLGGYHGLLMKKVASLVPKGSVLDVGCGLCHLYEALIEVKWQGRYVGIEINDLIYQMARERYPSLYIVKKDFYNIKAVRTFDTVCAIGLYRKEPIAKDGILKLIQASSDLVILTYFAKKIGKIPHVMKDIPTIHMDFVDHDIDPRLEIARIWHV